MCTRGTRIHLDGVHQSSGLNIQSFVSREQTVKATSVTLDPLIGYFNITAPFFSQVFDCGDEVKVALSGVTHARVVIPMRLTKITA
jgi:hypothetical protein